MAKFTLKRAPNPEKLKVMIPDDLFEKLNGIAKRANCSVDEVVSRALSFSLKAIQIEGE